MCCWRCHDIYPRSSFSQIDRGTSPAPVFHTLPPSFCNSQKIASVQCDIAYHFNKIWQWPRLFCFSREKTVLHLWKCITLHLSAVEGWRCWPKSGKEFNVTSSWEVFWEKIPNQEAGAGKSDCSTSRQWGINTKRCGFSLGVVFVYNNFVPKHCWECPSAFVQVRRINMEVDILYNLLN